MCENGRSCFFFLKKLGINHDEGLWSGVVKEFVHSSAEKDVAVVALGVGPVVVEGVVHEDDHVEHDAVVVGESDEDAVVVVDDAEGALDVVVAVTDPHDEQG